MSTDPVRAAAAEGWGEELQASLLRLFELYGVCVSVGLTKRGVAIRSLDDRVDASNLGPVTAREDQP